MRRRGFLAALIAAPFMPKAVLAAAERLAASPSPFSGVARSVLGISTSDLIAATIESRSKHIADSVWKNNALLMHLRMSPAERAEWNKPTARCRRRIDMRRDFPVQTRYRAWAERAYA